ncbi:MAG: polysaccharide deacetylase family protein [Armatimonadetes bacterium]|nr:polysaccharide deacetylase family protein [Armatimonadota bacterium]
MPSPVGCWSAFTRRRSCGSARRGPVVAVAPSDPDDRPSGRALRRCLALARHALLLAGSMLGIPDQGPLAAESGRRITVVLRYDDYCSQSPTDFETWLMQVLDRYQIRCTFAVIPRICAGNAYDPRPQDVVPLDATKAAILRRAMKGGVAGAAVHGLTHQTTRPDQPGQWSEFAGLPEAEQAQRLATARREVEQALGQPVTAFVPPWNSYDANTLTALETAGYTILSAEPDRPILPTSSLQFAPATCDLAGLRQAVAQARRLPDARSLITVLFHSYDVSELDRDQGNLSHSALEELFAWLAGQKDVVTRTLDDLVAEGMPLGADRFAANYIERPGPLLLPFTGAPRPGAAVYREPQAIVLARWRATRLSALLYFTAAGTAFALPFGALRLLTPSRRRRVATLALALSAAGLALTLAYCLYDSQTGWIQLSVLVTLLGAALGCAASRGLAGAPVALSPSAVAGAMPPYHEGEPAAH